MEIDDKSWKQHIPVGFRFCPTIDEIFIYLSMKVCSSHPIPAGIIDEFDVYERQPSDLPGCGKDDSNNKYAYFFTPRDKMNMNPNAKNQRRITKDKKGSWKATSKPIHYAEGKKNTLVYHLKTDGKALKKTNWIMHEFVLHDVKYQANAQGKNIVLCRIYQRNEESAKQEKQQNLVSQEEYRINIDEVEAEPQPVRTLKRKGRPGDQPPDMSRESSIDHHQYYHEPGLPQPKMALYSPTHYTEPESANIGKSSHGYEFQSNQVQEQIGVPLSYPIPSPQYVNQGPMFYTTNTSNEFLFGSTSIDQYRPWMMSRSLGSLISVDEPQPLQDFATNNNVNAWEDIQQQQHGMHYRHERSQELF